MDKLIHLSEACDLMEKYANRNPDVSSLCYDIRYGLMRLPTVSPDEVRGVGEWIDDSVASNVFRCSICENDAPVSPTDGTEYKSNYCPNCGAKMKV